MYIYFILAFDIQPLFKCKGTFVGHQVNIVQVTFILIHYPADSPQLSIVKNMLHSFLHKVFTGTVFFRSTLKGPVWTLCTHGEWLFSGSSDKTIKVMFKVGTKFIFTIG